MSELSIDQIQKAIKILEKNEVNIDNGKPSMMWVNTTQFNGLRRLFIPNESVEQTRKWLLEYAKPMGDDSFMVEF